jgi:hypothetical protein
MKIAISKKEYLVLLQILEMAQWVVSAHATGEQPEAKPFDDLEQKIFAMAKEYGLESLVKFDKQLEQYFVTRHYEETSSAMEFIDTFENDSFWETLIDRLTERDVIKEVGSAVLSEMEPKERYEAYGKWEHLYAQEFEKHGLERIEIVTEIQK